MTERKTLSGKVEQAEAATMEGGAGLLAGRIAGIGNMDRGGDVIAPGAFASALPAFRASGTMLLAHEWGGLPVGTVRAAEEVDGALLAEAEFLSDAESQTARARVAELHSRGRNIGLSVGMTLTSGHVRWFDSGAGLADAAAKDGIQVDDAGCRAWTGYCRMITGVEELFEFSLVAVPMNPAAYSTQVKTIFGGDGAWAGLTLDDHLVTVLAAVGGVERRLARLAADRSEGSRRVSPATVEKAAELARSVESFVRDQSRPDLRGAADALLLRARSLAL